MSNRGGKWELYFTEYSTEYSCGLVYPYFSIFKSKPLFSFAHYLFVLSIYLLIYLFIYYCYYLIITIIFLHICFKYASNVRAAWIIVPYNDGFKAPTRQSGRGRSCLAFVRSRTFGLGIAPKEKLSRLFNPVSIQK